MALDDLSGLPRYVQVAREIEQEIREGVWQPGKPAPSINVLCQRYGIARATAGRAHELLVKQGYVIAAPGIGMVVTPPERWPPTTNTP